MLPQLGQLHLTFSLRLIYNDRILDPFLSFFFFILF